MHALILHDALEPNARADELDVFEQAAVFESALAALGWQSSRMPFDFDLREASRRLRACAPDVVVNLVESVERSGRWIHLAPTLLDSLVIPYTGNPAEAIYTTSHKLAAKRVLAAADVPTPPWRTRAQLREHSERLAGTWIVKSVWEHGSVGLDDSAVRSEPTTDELATALDERDEVFGGEGFAEGYVEGREFNVAMLQRADGQVAVLPKAEILFRDFGADRRRIVGYRAKWLPESFEYDNTPRTFEFADDDGERALLAEIDRLARRCWQLFGLRGYARVDFRVSAEGTPYVLEVNTNPCLSPDAGFAAALAAAEISPLEAVRDLLAGADCSR